MAHNSLQTFIFSLGSWRLMCKLSSRTYLPTDKIISGRNRCLYSYSRFEPQRSTSRVSTRHNYWIESCTAVTILRDASYSCYVVNMQWDTLTYVRLTSLVNTGWSKSSPTNGDHTWGRVRGVIRGREPMSGNAPLRPCEYFSWTYERTFGNIA